MAQRIHVSKQDSKSLRRQKKKGKFRHRFLHRTEVQQKVSEDGFLLERNGLCLMVALTTLILGLIAVSVNTSSELGLVKRLLNCCVFAAFLEVCRLRY